MQSFRYPHLPPHLSTVHLALYTNVTTSAEIRARIVRASQLQGPDGDAEREALNFAFIDARLVCLSLVVVYNPKLNTNASRYAVCCICRQRSTKPS